MKIKCLEQDAPDRGRQARLRPGNLTGALALGFCIVTACISGIVPPASAGNQSSSNLLLAQADQAWRATPPKLPAPKSFNLPQVKTYKLDNGLKVQLVEDHRVPYVTSALGIKSGTSVDRQENLGVAELAADMLNEGTKTKTSKQIAEESDLIGGALGAVTDYDFTILTGSALSNYTDRLFSLMSDILLNPTFPEDELKLKKTNWIQSLTMKRAQPDFLLQERFRKVVFGTHPYGVVSPKPEMISKITRDDLKKFHQNYLIPNDSVLLVIGDFDTSKMQELIKTSFGDWKKGERVFAKLPEVTLQKERRVYLVDRPNSDQSSIVLGNLGIKKTDPDYFNARVMNQILGGSAHSRLFLNIREQKGYTYGAYSSIPSRVAPDVFSAGADVRTDVTTPAIKEFLFELERMRTGQVTKDELDDAKNYIVGQYQLQLETQGGLTQRLLEVNLYNLPDNYLETFSDKIMAVTVDDVQKVSQRVIRDKDLVITVVGDANKIKSGLASFGRVEVYNLNGDVVTTDIPAKGPDS